MGIYRDCTYIDIERLSDVNKKMEKYVCEKNTYTKREK